MRAWWLSVVLALVAASVVMTGSDAFLAPRPPGISGGGGIGTRSRRSTPHAGPAAGSSGLVRRDFTVGGDPSAADAMTLQETFNAATAMASLIVGGLVALEVRVRVLCLRIG